MKLPQRYLQRYLEVSHYYKIERRIMKHILWAIILTSALLRADFTLKYTMEGNISQNVQYKDAKHVLITTKDIASGEIGSQLILGDKRFMIMNEEGKTKYMDLDVLAKQMQQLTEMFGMGSLVETDEVLDKNKTVIKILKKGKSTTVAGVKGELWTVKFKEEEKHEQFDIVVTNNKKIVDAVYKYLAVMKDFAQMEEEEDEGLESIVKIVPGYVTIAFHAMQLKSFHEVEIPQSIYALPKEINIVTPLGQSSINKVDKQKQLDKELVETKDMMQGLFGN